MSEAIKKMLAEREAASRKPVVASDHIIDEVMEQIDMAAWLLDDDAQPNRFKPSTILKLRFLIAATAGNSKAAAGIAYQALSKARAKYEAIARVKG